MSGRAEDEEEEENQAPFLVPLMAVGMADIPGAVQLVGKDVVAYAYGRCVCTYSSDKEVGARMSEPLRTVRAVTCLESSPDHSVLAAGEQTSDGTGPAVAIFNALTLERVATLRGAGVSTKYTSLCFTSDGVTLLGSGFNEESQRTVFHLWEWQTNALPTASGSVPGCMTKVTIDPKFHNSLVLHSPDEVLSLRRHSTGFREQPITGLSALGSCHYIDHAWLPDGSFVVATSQRELQIMNLVTVTDLIKVDYYITALAVMSDSSILVAQQKGLLSLYVRRREGGPYHKQADLNTPDNPHSTSLNVHISYLSALSTEDRIAVYIHHGPIYIINMKLPKTSVYKGENAGDVWDQILPNFHEGSIISCSVAIKRDYFVTASKDLTVRLWQYSPLRLIITHMCHVAPMVVTMDPWAANLVITYIDGCKYYNIVEGMLLEVGELMTEYNGQELSIEKVQVAKFNPTGSLVAVVEGTTGRHIYIYSTLHLKQLAKLEGHHERVHDIAWSEDGFYLCSSSDGQIFTWQMDGFQRVQEDTSKGYSNDSLCCTADFKHLVVGDNLQGLRLMSTLRGGTAAGGESASAAATPGASRFSGNQPAKRSAVSAGGGGNPGQKAGRQLNGKGLGGLKKDTQEETSKRHMADEVPELTVLGTVAVMQPNRTCLAMVDTDFTLAVVGGGAMGRMRVAPLPPAGPEDFREYFAHTTDVCQVVVHAVNNLVFSIDTQGGWILHALLPQQLADGMMRSPRANLVRQHRRSTRRATATNGSMGSMGRPGFSVPIKMMGEKSFHVSALKAAGDLEASPQASQAMLSPLSLPAVDLLPPFYAMAHAAQQMVHEALTRVGDDMEIISVRSVDVQLMKEAVREVREKMAKAAAEFEYKLYEKEKELTRQFEGEIIDLRGALDRLTTEHSRQSVALEQAHRDRAAKEASLRAELVARLARQQEAFDSKLANEIDRTNSAEREVARIKAKFGKKLWQLDDERQSSEMATSGTVRTLEGAVVNAKVEAANHIVAARRNMEVEMRMDSELNEEELGRTTEAVQKLVEEKEDKYMTLLSKHTLQTGINNKTNEENEKLRVDNDMLKKESARCSEMLRATKEELETMHQAWMERDVKQKQQERVMSDMAYQLQQSELYTTLANTRIRELNEEIDPLRISKAEVIAQVGAMEGASLRALDTKHKILMEHGNLGARLENTAEELKEVRATATRREHYFQNFAAQLFRTMHNVNHKEWPILFGKLYDDYNKGQDKADWRKYEEHDPLGKNGAYGDGSGLAQKAQEAVTQAEFEEQMGEMHQQLMHTERMMSQMNETRERTEKARSAVISKLMSDNTTIMNELNTYKRELRTAREVGDRQGAELHTLRAALPSGSAGANMLRASASRASMQSKASGDQTPPNEEAEPSDNGPSAWLRPAPGAAFGPPADGAAFTSTSASDIGPPSSSSAAPTSLPPATVGGIPALTSPSRATLPPKPPSRLGDPGRALTSATAGLSSAGAGLSGMSPDNRGGGLSGASPGPNGGLTSPRAESAPLRAHSRGGSSDATMSMHSMSRRMASASIPEAAPQVVTGDMPSGGWWLGDNNLFEVPSNMAILNGESTATRRAGGFSQGSRPATLNQQAVSIRHDQRQREAALAHGGSGSTGGDSGGSGLGGFSPHDLMPSTPTPGGGTGGHPMRTTSMGSMPGSPGQGQVGYHSQSQLHARPSGASGGGSGAGASAAELRAQLEHPGRHPPLDGSGGGGGGERSPSSSSFHHSTSNGLRPHSTGHLVSLPSHGSTMSSVPRPTSQQSALLAYLQGLHGQMRAGQQGVPQRATTLGAGFRSFSNSASGGAKMAGLAGPAKGPGTVGNGLVRGS